MLFRFWRWLTCGHGRHRWRLHTALDLGLSSIEMFGVAQSVLVARHCPRCDTTEVLE